MSGFFKTSRTVVDGEPVPSISLVLPAHMIDEHTMVTKAAGQKRYELLRGLKIYVKDGTGEHTEVRPPVGSVFLAGDAGDAIEQISSDTRLAIHFVSLTEFIEFVEYMDQRE